MLNGASRQTIRAGDRKERLYTDVIDVRYRAYADLGKLLPDL